MSYPAIAGHSEPDARVATAAGGIDSPTADREQADWATGSEPPGCAGAPVQEDGLTEAGEAAGRRHDAGRDARAAELALDLADSGWQEKIADRLAETLGDRTWQLIDRIWTPEHCELLAKLADKLDEIHAKIHSGIATVVRIVIRLTGAPDIVAALFGELVARAISLHFLAPLHGFAQMLRVTGTLACAGHG